MSKKNKKTTVVNKFTTLVKATKENATKVNDFALKTTENSVTELIQVASQWQATSEKAVKGGLKVLENQQNLFFNTLENYKSQLVNSKKRIQKIFA